MMLVRLFCSLANLHWRILLIVAQLSLHAAIVQFTGFEFPSTGKAIRAMSGSLPPIIISWLAALNSAANYAKHSQFTACCPRFCCFRRRQRRRQSDDQEFYDVVEPQKLRIRLADHVRPPVPVIIKLADHLPACTPPVQHHVSAGPLHALQSLVEAQNFTIAKLAHELDYWKHAVSEIHRHAKASTAAQSPSLDARFAALREDVNSMIRHAAHELNMDMKNMMLEKDTQFTEMVGESARSMVNATAAFVGKMSKSVDAKLSARLANMNSRLAQISASCPGTAAPISSTAPSYDDFSCEDQCTISSGNSSS